MRKESIRIDCPQFEDALPDLDRPGTQGSKLREVALAHAESCGRCARLLIASESLDLSLRSLAAREVTRTAPPRVEAALLGEFRRQSGTAARRRLQWQLSMLGAAALLVLALGISLHRGIIRLPGLTQVAGAIGQPLASSETAVNNIAPSLQSDETADAPVFIALPYADDPAALEGGAVVRVVLSPAALASLGFDVADVSDTSEIPAELVVSDDGTPQAIRLVSRESLND
jgi:hypothetical protein